LTFRIYRAASLVENETAGWEEIAKIINKNNEIAQWCSAVMLPSGRVNRKSDKTA
jgi:hypothetical protein